MKAKTERAEGRRANHLGWVMSEWKEKPALIALLFFLTLLSSAVAVTYPYLTKLLLDTIQRLLADPSVPDPMAAVKRLVLVILAVGAGGIIASLFPGIRGVTNLVFEHALRSKYWKKVLGKDHRFFAAFASGDVVTRLTDDLYDFPKLSWFMCSGIFRAVESISKVSFCLVAMALLDWRLTLFSLVPLPLMIAIFYVTQDRIYDTFQRNQAAISAINTRLEMSFSGVRIIKAYACEDKYRRFFSEALATRWGTEMGVARLEVVLRMIYQYIDYVAQVGIVFAGGLLAVKGSITIGTFYAFYTYLSMLIFPILDIPQLFVSGKRAFVNIDRLEEMAKYPEPARAEAPVHISDIQTVEFDGVTFSYPGRPEPALRGVSFKLAKGERLGVIGPVGSGKSTMVKLALGLLPPSGGKVLVNGTELCGLDGPSYLRMVGYVPQEALLFSGTLRDNVDFGADEPSDALFDEAVDMAQLRDELRSFADREKTVVGQRGVSLSGGQRQRMAIARALARKPRLLLFDDITASLDASNEERLMRRLEASSRDLTYVVVSHRLSTLQYVDKVLFLEGGVARAFGTHEELLDLPWYRSFIEEHTGPGGRV